MSGRHEAPPVGSAAREATASPWHGKHRAPGPVCDRCGFPAVETAAGWAHGEAADAAFCALVFPRPLPPAPEFDSPFYATDGDDGN